MVNGGNTSIADEHRRRLENGHLSVFLLLLPLTVNAQDCLKQHPRSQEKLLNFLFGRSAPQLIEKRKADFGLEHFLLSLIHTSQVSQNVWHKSSTETLFLRRHLRQSPMFRREWGREILGVSQKDPFLRHHCFAQLSKLAYAEWIADTMQEKESIPWRGNLASEED